jgi:hypothetical protein
LIYGKSGRSGVCREHLIGVAWNPNKIMRILPMYGFTDIRVDPVIRRSIDDARRTPNEKCAFRGYKGLIGNIEFYLSLLLFLIMANF